MTEKRNISLTKSLTLEDVVVDIDILSNGMATGKNTINGYPEVNSKTAKPWRSGWPHKVDLLKF